MSWAPVRDAEPSHLRPHSRRSVGPRVLPFGPRHFCVGAHQGTLIITTHITAHSLIITTYFITHFTWAVLVSVHTNVTHKNALQHLLQNNTSKTVHAMRSPCSLRVYTYTHVCIRIHTCVYIDSGYMYMYTCTYMYIVVRVCTLTPDTHTPTNTHTHTHTSPHASFPMFVWCGWVGGCKCCGCGRLGGCTPGPKPKGSTTAR